MNRLKCKSEARLERGNRGNGERGIEELGKCGARVERGNRGNGEMGKCGNVESHREAGVRVKCNSRKM